MEPAKRQNSILVLKRKRDRMEARLAHAHEHGEPSEEGAAFAAEWKRLDSAIKAAETDS